MNWGWILLTLAIGTIFGFFICAALTMSKIADLKAEICKFIEEIKKGDKNDG